MIMAGFDGRDGSGPIASLIADRHAGNVVLLQPNVVNQGQAVALSRRLQAMARDANDGIGLLISLDQEGGAVRRLPSPPFSYLPSARQLASTDNPTQVRSAAMGTAREMRSVGFNLDLAPVLDVNDNPANPVIGYRAFGVDPQTVTTYGLAFLDGLRAGGVASAIKHFPGHGNTAQDSHVTLPYVTKSDASLRATELVPFQAAIAHGADAVMVGHVVYTAWDADRPASLSPRIIQGILRDELGYQGVVLTDDLNMGAITQRYGPTEAAVLAVQAGADLLLIDGPPSSETAMIGGLLQAVQTGRIPRARIDESVARILALKQRLGLVQP